MCSMQRDVKLIKKAVYAKDNVEKNWPFVLPLSDRNEVLKAEEFLTHSDNFTELVSMLFIFLFYNVQFSRI